MKKEVLAKANDMKAINELSLKGEIVVFGSTYMAGFPFYELVNKCRLENAVYNRSICGMTIAEAAELLQGCVLALKPRKIFLALGEEDAEEPCAIEGYTAIVQRIRAELPDTQVYLICLNGDSAYVRRFNQNIDALCDKKTHAIRFDALALPYAAECKRRFKQLSCFFRDRKPELTEIFAMSQL